MRLSGVCLCALLVWGCSNPVPPSIPTFSVAFIGSSEPSPQTSIEQTRDTFTLRGRGEYLTETKDDFTFAWTPIRGDWNWDVQLTDVRPGALAGVMIRTSRERGASHFFAGTPGDGILIVQTRLDRDGYTYHPLPIRLPRAPLHFHLEKREGEPGELQVRDGTGFLMLFSFPDFVADTLLVGVALKGPADSFVSFTQIPVSDLKPVPTPTDTNALSRPGHPEVKIVSHRGAIYSSPENSLLSRDAAVHCGADVIELDVRLSQDGVPVVIHDDYLQRSTNGKGDVANRSWAELQKLSLRNPDGSVSPLKIPSLDAYLAAPSFDGLWLLDKAWPIRDQVVPHLSQAGLLKRCIFKGTGSAKEAQTFLAGFPEDARPLYLHLIRDSIPGERMDSLMKMDILGFDLQTADSGHVMLQPAFSARLKQEHKVLMMSPFVPQFAGGRSELWHPYPCWDWLAAHGVTWMQTDLPCELEDWRRELQ